MVLDGCFPSNNEEAFISAAERLALESLLFIYPNKKKAAENHQKIKTPLNVFYGFVDKKHGFFEELSVLSSEKRFCFIPDLRISLTQVHIKEISCLSLPLLLQAGDIKNQKKPEYVKKLSFVLKLCNKYKIEVVGVSCASEPKKLISHHEVMSLLRLL